VPACLLGCLLVLVDSACSTAHGRAVCRVGAVVFVCSCCCCGLRAGARFVWRGCACCCAAVLCNRRGFGCCRAVVTPHSLAYWALTTDIFDAVPVSVHLCVHARWGVCGSCRGAGLCFAACLTHVCVGLKSCFTASRLRWICQAIFTGGRCCVCASGSTLLQPC
jgi:hypothetical protein